MKRRLGKESSRKKVGSGWLVYGKVEEVGGGWRGGGWKIAAEI